MKWFYNMKISVKLLTSFIIVALIAGVVGVIGVVNVTKINRQYINLYDNFGIPIGNMGEISTQFQLSRVYLRDVVLEKDEANRTKYVGKINECDKIISEQLGIFKKTIQTEEGQVEFKSLLEGLEEFKPIKEKIISLARNNKDQEALALIRGDGAKPIEKVGSAIDNLFEMKVSGGQQGEKDYSKGAESTIMQLIVIAISAIIIAVLLGIIVSKIICNPIKKLMNAAEVIADGDLSVEIPVDTKDEVGKLAKAFREMSDNINDAMTNINTASEQVASGSKQVSYSSMALSQGTTEQASSVEELTSSVEEISAQTEQNAEKAKTADSLAEIAKMEAENGNSQMDQMLKAMEEINVSSDNIFKIIKVIDDIAFQTNILALNAAVEAARAGQHGRGFAVVAEEVRNLAVRSANAAQETTAMIEGSIKKVEGGTKTANKTAAALGNIIDGINKVSGLVKEIAAASNQQAIGISQINQGIIQISEVVQTNSATAEESAAASEELSGQAEELKRQASKFKLKNKYAPTITYTERPFAEGSETGGRMDSAGEPHFAQGSEFSKSQPAPKSILLNAKEFGKY
ncbi:MAG: methyl-accepting chemotaxis protein [Oscillospiraceae bacterium]|nr:methyl-accepting chemotaxis protein [Oscillospiraceae bacterium]